MHKEASVQDVKFLQAILELTFPVNMDETSGFTLEDVKQALIRNGFQIESVSGDVFKCLVKLEPYEASSALWRVKDEKVNELLAIKLEKSSSDNKNNAATKSKTNDIFEFLKSYASGYEFNFNKTADKKQEEAQSETGTTLVSFIDASSVEYDGIFYFEVSTSSGDAEIGDTKLLQKLFTSNRKLPEGEAIGEKFQAPWKPQRDKDTHNMKTTVAVRSFDKRQAYDELCWLMANMSASNISENRTYLSLNDKYNTYKGSRYPKRRKHMSDDELLKYIEENHPEYFKKMDDYLLSGFNNLMDFFGTIEEGNEENADALMTKAINNLSVASWCRFRATRLEKIAFNRQLLSNGTGKTNYEKIKELLERKFPGKDESFYKQKYNEFKTKLNDDNTTLSEIKNEFLSEDDVTKLPSSDLKPAKEGVFDFLSNVIFNENKGTDKQKISYEPLKQQKEKYTYFSLLDQIKSLGITGYIPDGVETEQEKAKFTLSNEDIEKYKTFIKQYTDFLQKCRKEKVGVDGRVIDFILGTSDEIPDDCKNLATDLSSVKSHYANLIKQLGAETETGKYGLKSGVQAVIKDKLLECTEDYFKYLKIFAPIVEERGVSKTGAKLIPPGVKEGIKDVIKEEPIGESTRESVTELIDKNWMLSKYDQRTVNNLISEELSDDALKGPDFNLYGLEEEKKEGYYPYFVDIDFNKITDQNKRAEALAKFETKLNQIEKLFESEGLAAELAGARVTSGDSDELKKRRKNINVKLHEEFNGENYARVKKYFDDWRNLLIDLQNKTTKQTTEETGTETSSTEKFPPFLKEQSFDELTLDEKNEVINTLHTKLIEILDLFKSNGLSEHLVNKLIRRKHEKTDTSTEKEKQETEAFQSKKDAVNAQLQAKYATDYETVVNNFSSWWDLYKQWRNEVAGEKGDLAVEYLEKIKPTTSITDEEGMDVVKECIDQLTNAASIKPADMDKLSSLTRKTMRLLQDNVKTFLHGKAINVYMEDPQVSNPQKNAVKNRLGLMKQISNMWNDVTNNIDDTDEKDLYRKYTKDTFKDSVIESIKGIYNDLKSKINQAVEEGNIKQLEEILKECEAKESYIENKVYKYDEEKKPTDTLIELHSLFSDLKDEVQDVLLRGKEKEPEYTSSEIEKQKMTGLNKERKRNTEKNTPEKVENPDENTQKEEQGGVEYGELNMSKNLEEQGK